jgi:hypothetical protein
MLTKVDGMKISGEKKADSMWVKFLLEREEP